MLTNISRQLNTGALAIAGSVAALSFAGAAQAASMIAVTGSATASSWGTLNPTLTPGAPTGLAGTPTDGFAGLSYTDVSAIQPIQIFGTGSGASTMFTPGGTVNSFAQINVGGGTTVNITPTVASGTFNTSGGMSTTVYTVMGTAFFDATTGLDYSGVFSLNVVSVGSGWIYTWSLEKSSLAVPEPSAILGILAVVGAGAFARRKS